jgi:hypothetical protein
MSIESLSDKAKPFYVTQAEIDATHPMNDGVTCYAEDEAALQLVGERHGKRELVDLVRTLLIRAYQAKGAKPVAHFIETSPGNWEQAAALYASQPGVIPLYAHPAPAIDKPAQPVEAVDKDSREFVLRAMATNYSDSHSWDHLDADACRRGADEIKALRAVVAHPRPTGDAKVLTTQSILDRIEAVAHQADSAMHSSDERHLRNTLEIVADDLTAIIAAERVHAPTGEQAGEVVDRMALGGNGALDAIPENEEQRVIATKYAVRALRLANLDVLPFVNGWLACHTQPRPVCVPDGLADADNPWRRAVEHAGYLVTAVADYMEASANAGAAIEQVEGIEEPTDEQLEELHSAQEDADEARSRMRDLCYEFTKRRDRALATLAAAPEVPRG